MKSDNEKIVSFLRDAVTNKQKHGTIYVGSILPATANKIQAATGFDVHGFKLGIDADHARHVWNEHPQIDLGDFLLIKEIVNAPDLIIKGHGESEKTRTTGTGKRKKDGGRIVFQKQLIYKYTCVEFIVAPRKLLMLKTLWATKKPVRGVASKKKRVHK